VIVSLNPTDQGAIHNHNPTENAKPKENALNQKKTVISRVAIVSKLPFLDNCKSRILTKQRTEINAYMLVSKIAHMLCQISQI